MQTRKIVWLLGSIILLLVSISVQSSDSVDGFVVVDPVGDQSCLAVRVVVEETQAVAGLRWFNGSAAANFSKVLVASGSDIVPPPYDEAIVLAESPAAVEDGWSGLVFSEPVASLSGTLFIVLQYPPHYVPVEGVSPLGIGYQTQTGQTDYFVSADGDHWLKVSDQCRLLLEPVYTTRDPDTLAKGAVRDDAQDPKAPPLPVAFSLRAYPNPFNPETQLELSLPQPERVSVKVFDLKGRLVRVLFAGNLQAGAAVFRWDGRDGKGQPSGSGVYWVMAEAGEKTLTNRVVLVK